MKTATFKKSFRSFVSTLLKYFSVKANCLGVRSSIVSNVGVIVQKLAHRFASDIYLFIN